jgi:hypothetical protein
MISENAKEILKNGLDLKVITLEEFYELNKKEDLCFEVAEGKISDDEEDYYNELDWVTSEEDLRAAVNSAKNIMVMKKERYKLPKGLIIEQVSSYLEDNYGYDGYELGYLEDMIGSEVFEQCENKINEYIKGWYTEGEIEYCLDMSKEVEEYLREELNAN